MSRKATLQICDDMNAAHFNGVFTMQSPFVEFHKFTDYIIVFYK